MLDAFFPVHPVTEFNTSETAAVEIIFLYSVTAVQVIKSGLSHVFQRLKRQVCFPCLLWCLFFGTFIDEKCIFFSTRLIDEILTHNRVVLQDDICTVLIVRRILVLFILSFDTAESISILATEDKTDGSIRLLFHTECGSAVFQEAILCKCHFIFGIQELFLANPLLQVLPFIVGVIVRHCLVILTAHNTFSINKLSLHERPHTTHITDRAASHCGVADLGHGIDICFLRVLYRQSPYFKRSCRKSIPDFLHEVDDPAIDTLLMQLDVIRFRPDLVFFHVLCSFGCIHVG